MKLTNTIFTSTKPTVLVPCFERNLGFKGNISIDRFNSLIEQGKALHLNLYINGEKSSITMGIEDPSHTMLQSFSNDLTEIHVKSAVYEQLDSFAFWLKLMQSPKSQLSNSPVKVDYWSFHNKSFNDGKNQVTITASIGANERKILNLSVHKFPTELMKPLMVINRTTDYELSEKTYDYIPETVDTQEVKARVNQYLKIKPSIYSTLLLTKAFQKISDVHDVISVIQTQHDSEINYDQLQGLIPNLYKLSSFLSNSTFANKSNDWKSILDPENAEALDEWLNFEQEIIEDRIESRRKFINSIDNMFVLKHYGIPSNIIIQHSKSGILALADHGDIERNHNMNVTNLVRNLLPEKETDHESAQDVSKFISKPQRLVSSFAFEPTTLERSFNSMRKSGFRFKSSRLNADSIDHHLHSLSDEAIFKGVVDDLPKNDKNFYSNIVSDFLEAGGVLISGVQRKCMMNLYVDENGQQGLQFSRGNIPSTHIAKWPMFGKVDNLAVAEWLGLTLCKAAGLETAKFQIVRSLEKDAPVNEDSTNLENESEIMDMIMGGSIGDQNNDNPFSMNSIFMASDKNDEIDKLIKENVIHDDDGSMKHPPFFLSERFDIPYDDHNSKTMFFAQDFCGMAQRSSSQKYDYDMEGVASLLKYHIADPQMLEKSQEHLLRLIMASLCVANNDLHLKNLTLLTEVTPNGVKMGLSPVYDVLVAPMVHDRIKTKDFHQALPLNQTKRPTVNDIINFAEKHLDIDGDKAKQIVNQVIDSILSKCNELSQNAESIFDNDPDLTEKLKVGLGYVARNTGHIVRYGQEWSKNTKSKQFQM